MRSRSSAEKGTGIEQAQPCFFVPDGEKVFRATPVAVEMFTRDAIDRCLGELQVLTMIDCWEGSRGVGRQR